MAIFTRMKKGSLRLSRISLERSTIRAGLGRAANDIESASNTSHRPVAAQSASAEAEGADSASRPHSALLELANEGLRFNQFHTTARRFRRKRSKAVA
jgi:hypothetical protein